MRCEKSKYPARCVSEGGEGKLDLLLPGDETYEAGGEEYNHAEYYENGNDSPYILDGFFGSAVK